MVSNKYLRAFIVGSSFVALLPFFLVVNSTNLQISNYIPLLKILNLHKRNYSFEQYVFIAPLFLGFVNMLSLYISTKYTIVKSNRYLWASLFIPTFVILFSFIGKFYSFDQTEWINYILLVYCGHFILWNYIIRYLENNI
jgi:hypothetical protein